MEHTLNIKELNFIVISLCKSWVISCLSIECGDLIHGRWWERVLHDTKYLKNFHKWLWFKTWCWTRCLRNKRNNPKFHSCHILCPVLCFVSECGVPKVSSLGHLFIELLVTTLYCLWIENRYRIFLVLCLHFGILKLCIFINY